jgi:hypothetical protein
MPELILPSTLAVLLAAFAPCFQVRSVVVFQWLVVGWVQCQGRRSLTSVALASGAVAERHISAFHRFFSRTSWTPDALGRMVFTLALRWLPAVAADGQTYGARAGHPYHRRPAVSVYRGIRATQRPGRAARARRTQLSKA